MILGLVGPKLAGKGTVARFYVEQHHASIYRMSSILSDILYRLHQENSRKNLVTLVGQLRELYGDHILAETLKKDIERDPNRIIVIDGIRRLSEHEIFKSLSGYQLMYIDASLEIRYQRSKNRTEKSDELDMSFEEFTQRESDASENEIELLKQYADHLILNNGTLDELYHQLPTALSIDE